MGEVFLLGAGFSKAISDEMPLLVELSGQIKEREPNLLSPSLATLGDNLEIWLSYLSQPHPWLRESANLRNRATALEIADILKKVLDEKERLAIETGCPSWLQKLTEAWHKTKAGVISLNYDSLVERAATKISTGESSHLSADQLYPVQLTLSSRRNAAVLGSSREEEGTFTLFKLHGSTNWYYSGSAEPTGEVIYYTHIVPWGEPDPRRDGTAELEKEAVSDKVPLIVPPTTEKARFFQHESLKLIWARAASSLSAATALFVVGYSLSITDLAVRLFLHDAGRQVDGRKSLYIVNSDSNVVGRYCEMLGQAYEINADYVGENAIERFVDEMV